MKSRMSILGVALFCLAGCLVPSLHPLYNESDKLVIPELAGDWTTEDGDALWLFQTEPDSSYALAYVESNDTSWFVAHLLSLGNDLFMDMYPDPSDVLSDAYKEHLIGAHTFSRIELDSNGLTISVLDSDWLRGQVESGSLKIAHELLGPGDLVLTAGTDDLQKFIGSIADDSLAFASIQLTKVGAPDDSI